MIKKGLGEVVTREEFVLDGVSVVATIMHEVKTRVFSRTGARLLGFDK